MNALDIRTHVDSDGGLTAWIAGTNIQGYAYPTSPLAVQARRNLARAADALIQSTLAALPVYVEVCGYDRMAQTFANRMAAIGQKVPLWLVPCAHPHARGTYFPDACRHCGKQVCPQCREWGRCDTQLRRFWNPQTFRLEWAHGC